MDECKPLARGYVAIAPDTFEGKSTKWIPRAITLVTDTILAAEWGAAPLSSALRWAAANPAVDPSRVAGVGFCYGGGAVLRLAAAAAAAEDESGVLPALKAVAVFYGKPLGRAVQVNSINPC